MIIRKNQSLWWGLSIGVIKLQVIFFSCIEIVCYSCNFHCIWTDFELAYFFVWTSLMSHFILIWWKYMRFSEMIPKQKTLEIFKHQSPQRWYNQGKLLVPYFDYSLYIKIIITLICTRKSLRWSLKAGMSWSKLNSPCTVIFTWLSVRWGNAVFKRFATYSWNCTSVIYYYVLCVCFKTFFTVFNKYIV